MNPGRRTSFLHTTGVPRLTRMKRQVRKILPLVTMQRQAGFRMVKGPRRTSAAWQTLLERRERREG